MKSDDRQVNPGKHQGHAHGQIPQHPLEGSDLKPVIPILADPQKAVERGGQQQRHRGIVAENHNAPVQQLHGRQIRPLRGLKLGKRRQPLFFRQLFQNSAVQNAVHLITADPVAGQLHQIRIGNPFHIEHVHQRIRSGSQKHFLHLQVRAADPFPDQGSVHLHRLREALVGSPQHLFRLGQSQRFSRIPLASDFQYFIVPVDEKDHIPCQQGPQPVLQGFQLSHVGNSHAVFVQIRDQLLPRNFFHPGQQPPQHGFLQHHVGHRNLQVDSQAGGGRISQPHGPKQDVRATCALLLQPTFVFPDFQINLCHFILLVRLT